MNTTLKKTLLGTLSVAILGVAIWGGAYYWKTGRFQVATDDAYVQADFTAVAPKVTGYIAEVLVSDNQAIRAFGTASLVGEVCCLATAMLVAPAILAVGARGRATAAVPASSSSATLHAVAA